MATDALALDAIDAYYGDSHVLHGVSFALPGGRLLGLLGRNGAGKTTCMSAIIGVLKPRRGTISLYGEAIAGLAPDAIARKGVGLVPQGRRIFRSLSVRENLVVAAQRRDVRALLQAIPRDVTIVMIEHDMDVALEFAERITVLHFGEVVVEGLSLIHI